MLNYANLNDVEFEYLCQDIMQKKLGMALHRFASGRDGGVDLTDDVAERNIVVQVKHYQKSTTSALVSSIESELPKVKKLSPEQYYVCCSRELTPKNIQDIYNTFREFMASADNIITLTEIDSFLKNPDNTDVLQKHYKLWLDSTGILENIFTNGLFVDCEVLLYNIEEDKKLFVRTSAFDSALKLIQKNKAIMIVGNPGVGKTITSKMLVLYYAAQGYQVRYTTNGADLNTLKRSMSRDPDKKEIVLVDDCFGQAYFEMKESQNNELLSLIKYIRMSKNKLLILNSRVTIYKEAKSRSVDLVKSLDKKEYKVFIIDMDCLSAVEKAKILYNHLAFNNVPPEYYHALVEKRRYLSIVNHPNYCPRIIEHVCTPRIYQEVSANQFFSLFESSLSNPRETWENEFKYRLQKADRLLILTVYSLTETFADYDFVKACFDHRIAEIPDIDKTINQFEGARDRLLDGFIKISDVHGKKSLSLMNPSINDFLEAFLVSNQPEFEELVSSICSGEQILRLFPEEDFFEQVRPFFDGTKTGPFLFSSESKKVEQTACIISKIGLCNQKWAKELKSYLLSPCTVYHGNSIRVSSGEILSALLSEPLISYYGFADFLMDSDNLETVLCSSFIDLEDATLIVRQIYESISESNRKDFVVRSSTCLTELLEDYCNYVSADDYSPDVYGALQLSTYETPYGPEIDEEQAAEYVEDDVRTTVKEEIQASLKELPKEYTPLMDLADKIEIEVTGAEDLVASYISEGNADFEDDYQEAGPFMDADSEIDLIFNR